MIIIDEDDVSIEQLNETVGGSETEMHEHEGDDNRMECKIWEDARVRTEKEGRREKINYQKLLGGSDHQDGERLQFIYVQAKV